MGFLHAGFYHLFDEDNKLLVTRAVKVFSDNDACSAIAREGEKDIMFLSAPNVSIGVTLAKDENAAGAAFIDGHSAILKLRFGKHSDETCSVRIPGRCNNCLNALAEYHYFIKHGITECPYCHEVFTAFESSSLADVETIFVAKKPKEFENVLCLPPFKLPFGYPRPREVFPKDLSAIENLNNFLVTDTENTEFLKESFLEILNRNGKRFGTTSNGLLNKSASNRAT